MLTVGAFEAKTKLSELLDAVERGEEVTITRRGEPVARLVAIRAGDEKARVRALIEEIDILPASAYAHAGAIRDIDTAASLLGRRPEIASTLITHRFPLEAGVEAFETAARRSEGAIKVVLEP